MGLTTLSSHILLLSYAFSRSHHTRVSQCPPPPPRVDGRRRFPPAGVPHAERHGRVLRPKLASEARRRPGVGVCDPGLPKAGPLRPRPGHPPPVGPDRPSPPARGAGVRRAAPPEHGRLGAERPDLGARLLRHRGRGRGPGVRPVPAYADHRAAGHRPADRRRSRHSISREYETVGRLCHFRGWMSCTSDLRDGTRTRHATRSPALLVVSPSGGSPSGG